jgi:hypothetical protein
MDIEVAWEVVTERGWLSKQPEGFRNELLRRTVLTLISHRLAGEG